MRCKLFSALLTTILFTGLLFPFVLNANSGLSSSERQQVLAAEITQTWFHDGSNITGFASPVADLPTVGSLTSSGEYFYSDDLGSGSGWHGPAMTYTLEQSFQVSQMTSLNVEIEFDCFSSTNRLGALNVILYDSNEAPICRFIVSDAWADDRQMKLPFSWFYLDGSGYTTPYSEPNWVTFSPYYETLSLTKTSTGFLVTLPEIGAFEFPVDTSEELDRLVSFVTIRFLEHSTWTYCEEVFIHSLYLEWVGDETTTPSSSTTTSTTQPSTSTSSLTPPQSGTPLEEYILPISIAGGVVIIFVVIALFIRRSSQPSGSAPHGYDW